MTPFDQWDYDGVNENVLVNMNVDGKDRKVLVHFDRNGFAYVLDRTDGTLLRANKFVTVNWAERIDLKTGRPVKLELTRQESTLVLDVICGGRTFSQYEMELLSKIVAYLEATKHVE